MQLSIVAAITVSLILQDSPYFVASPHAIGWWPLAWAFGIATGFVSLSALHIVRQTHVDRCQFRMATVQQQQHLDTRYTMHIAVWLGVVLLTMGCFQWPQFCEMRCNSVAAKRLLLVLPIVCWLVVSWGILYSAERTLDRSLADISRWRFIQGQMRLFLVFPLTVILSVVIVHDLCEAWQLPQVIRIVWLLLILAMFPLLLRITWQTQELPGGSLRSRLEGIARHHDFSARKLLLWDTDNRMRNAAISGIIPAWRYVLLSDRLLRDLSPEQIECVFLHEIAHSKCGHQWKLISASIAVIGSSLAILCRSELLAVQSSLATGILGIVFLCVGLHLIGRLARLFEFEADRWVVQQGSRHPIRYLEAVAAICGSDTDKRTWTHPSFRERTSAILDADASRNPLQAPLCRVFLMLSTLITGAFVVLFLAV